MTNNAAHTRFLKEMALELGFSYVGVAKAEFMEPEARRLEDWLNKGHQGKMGYLENHFEKRVDPTKLVPGAQSVVSLVYNYFPSKKIAVPGAPKIARYAYGKDYHFVVKDKLRELLERLRERVGAVEGRCFVDSAPVLERDWARRAGVGWIGKNTMLIRPRAGSFFFLAELIIDLPLEPDGPLKDFCGSCTRCIDACPTEAIAPEGYEMDGSKCISYLTIELRDAIPNEFKDKMSNWMFGCDICQEVCPWNRFSSPNEEPAFSPHPELETMTRQDWEEITEETFRKVFKKSAVKRTKFAGLQRNIRFLYSDKTNQQKEEKP
ncbi:MAG: tRNA epoxyqueuosine(34) reductase QueG [Bacteroidota bacterium]